MILIDILICFQFKFGTIMGPKKKLSYACRAPRHIGDLHCFKKEGSNAFAVDAVLAVYNGNCAVTGEDTLEIATLTLMKSLVKKANILVKCREIMNMWAQQQSIPTSALEYIKTHHPVFWGSVPFIRNLIMNSNDELSSARVRDEAVRIAEDNNLPVDTFLAHDVSGQWEDQGDYTLAMDGKSPSDEAQSKFQNLFELDSECVSFLFGSNRKRVELSFIRILQHWCVDCRIPQESITKLLKLLKRHKPVIKYNRLPSSAKTLLKLDTRDRQGVTDIAVFSPTDPDTKLGTYIHYGLENAVFAESAGDSYLTKH